MKLIALALLYGCHRLADIPWRSRFQAWRQSLEAA